MQRIPVRRIIAHKFDGLRFLPKCNIVPSHIHHPGQNLEQKVSLVLQVLRVS